MILVSHEAPICLLNQSRHWNDFDYALVHLFEKYPEYYCFFEESRKYHDREVLLDNSIFELGKAFDPDKYKGWIEKLQPNCYIVPDVLEDSNMTCFQFLQWIGNQGKDGWASKARKIGVVQGKTFDQLVSCYKHMSYHADQIAISFDYSFYQIIGYGKTPLEMYCTGRQNFIQLLIDRGIWNWDKPVHLLGCSLAREFRYYVDKNIYNIRSCDTSNPVVAGIEGIKYDADFGLNAKSKTKLADLIDVSLEIDQKDLVEYNVKQFKRILGR